MKEAEAAVRRFLDGDEEAFERLVRLWESKVYNFAWRLLGNREDAQDATQETFLAVYRSLRTLRDPGSFPTWIYRIALNNCRARWRARSPEISLDHPVAGTEGIETEIGRALPAGRDEANLLEVRDLIRKSLMGISEDHRTAIVLKEYLGLNLEEVAQVMDCPLSTAKSRLYHGLRGVHRNLHRMGVPPRK